MGKMGNKGNKRIKEFGNATKGAREVAGKKKAGAEEARKVLRQPEILPQGQRTADAINVSPSPKLMPKELKHHIRDTVTLLTELGEHPRFNKNNQLDQNHGLVVAQRTMQGCVQRLKSIDEYL